MTIQARKVLVVLIVLFTLFQVSIALADTLLLGYDPGVIVDETDMSETQGCFDTGNANSLSGYKYKAMRVFSEGRSGTVDYFAIRTIGTYGCTSDEGHWGLYEDDPSGSQAMPGTLKGWGHFGPNFDWTDSNNYTYDVGDDEYVYKFPVTNIETDMTIEENTTYWIVILSEAMNFYLRGAGAGCTGTCVGTCPNCTCEFISQFRGRGQTGTDPQIWGQDTCWDRCETPGSAYGNSANCYTYSETVSPDWSAGPPTCAGTGGACGNNYFNYPCATWCAWGVFDETGGDTVPPYIMITNPTTASTYDNGSSSTVTVSGNTSDAAGYVTHVAWSNDRGGAGNCSLASGAFSRTITVYSGTNVLTFTAYDDSNNSASDTLTVTVSGTPQILSIVSGTVAHGNTVTISGNSFGAKDPVPPRVWDSCESGSTTLLSTFYDQGDKGPYCCGAGTIPNPGEADCEMQYRFDTDIPWHGYSPPNSRMDKLLGSCLTTTNGDWSGSATGDMMISIYPWDSYNIFAMYWYRIADTFHPVQCNDNFKEFVWSYVDNHYLNHSGDYCLDSYQTFGWCGNATPPNVGSGNDVYSGSYQANSLSTCNTANRVYYHNPIDGWVHWEIIADHDDFAAYSTTSDSNVNGYNVVKGTDQFNAYADILATSCIAAQPDSPGEYGPPEMITIGGFRRNDASTQTPPICYPSAATGNYQMFAGIYADDTFSRVMLGNASTWENCTKREPQIPVTWSNTQLSFQVNMGGFSASDDLYLYVFNASNVASASFQVEEGVVEETTYGVSGTVRDWLGDIPTTYDVNAFGFATTGAGSNLQLSYANPEDWEQTSTGNYTLDFADATQKIILLQVTAGSYRDISRWSGAYVTTPGPVYYLRADGTASNKSAATACGAASTAMSFSTHNSETFSPSDIIYLCDDGGNFNATLIPPSSGTTDHFITYKAAPGDDPTIDAQDTRDHCIELDSQDYLTFDNINMYNAVDTAVDGDSVASTNIGIKNCFFMDNANGAIEVNGSSNQYWTIDNNIIYSPSTATATGSIGIDIQQGPDHIIIQDNHIYYGGFGIRIGNNSTADVSSDVTIIRNQIKDYGDSTSTSHGIQVYVYSDTSDNYTISTNVVMLAVNDYDAMKLAWNGNPTNVTIADNIVVNAGTDTGDSGIVVEMLGSGTATITGNAATNMPTYGLRVLGGTGHTIKRNKIVNCGFAENDGCTANNIPWNCCTAADSGTCYEFPGISIHSATWTEASGSPNAVSSSNTLAYNILEDCGRGIGISVEDSLTNSGNSIFNSVIVGTLGTSYSTMGAGLYLYTNNGSAGTIANTAVKNNIIWSGAADYHIVVDSGSTSGLDVDTNLYYGLTTSGWRHTTTDYSTIATWNARTGVGDDLYDDPSFASGTYQLASTGSPCYNAATDVGETEDFDGTTVPQGSTPDIGAYEFTGATTGAPTITTATASWTHGNTVTITGSSFGYKSPASPVIWDDGEHGQSLANFTSDSGNSYSDYKPIVASPSTYNIQYHDTNGGASPFRGMTNPHSNGDTFLAGGHKENTDRSVLYGDGNGANVGVHYYFGVAQDDMYVHYYEALDPSFPGDGDPTYAPGFNTNFKEMDYYGGNNGTIYGGGGRTNYDGFAASGEDGCTPWRSACTNLAYTQNRGPDLGRVWCNNDTDYCFPRANLIGNWVAFEHIIDFDDIHLVRADNQDIFFHDNFTYLIDPVPDAVTVGGYGCYQQDVDYFNQSGWSISGSEYRHAVTEDRKHLYRYDLSYYDDGSGLMWHADKDMTKVTSGPVSAGQWRYSSGYIYVAENGDNYTYYYTNSGCGAAGGGFGHNGDDDAFRYYDDIYIDNTWSRVMLCDDPSYGDATICEPQPPETWINNTITVTVNKGALSTGNAYIFVFDSTGTKNGTGYQITLN